MYHKCVGTVLMEPMYAIVIADHLFTSFNYDPACMTWHTQPSPALQRTPLKLGEVYVAGDNRITWLYEHRDGRAKKYGNKDRCG